MVVMVLIVSAHLSPGRGRFLISFSQRLLRTLGFAFVLSWSRLLVVLFLLMTLETIIFSSCSNKLHRPRNMLTIGHGSHHQVLVYFKSGNWHRHHHHQKHQHHPPTTQSVSQWGHTAICIITGGHRQTELDENLPSKSVHAARGSIKRAAGGGVGVKVKSKAIIIIN